MDWGEGYTSTWRMYRVDEATWADAYPVDGFISAKITRAADGALLESGSFTIDGEAPGTGYYRLSMTARNSTGYERVDVATMRVEGTSGTYNRNSTTVTASGLSVLYPASVKKLLDGAYCPANTDAAVYVAQLLGSCIAAPIVVEVGFALNAPIVHEFGSSALDACWQVLGTIGAVMQLDGDGTVHIKMPDSAPALELDVAGASLVVPGVKRARNTAGIPNRYVAVGEFETAEAVNDDPASPVSTVSRGYEHTEVDESPTPVDGETLAAYAARKLQAASTVRDTRTYTREYWPGVLPYDMVAGSLSSVGIDGALRVTRQSLDCKHGILVTEEAAREEVLWQA